MADSQANDNTTCVVCFKNVLYYSIGECDHPVCFECSTRMRVLCLQNECPICRKDLSRVVFTDTVQPYKELHIKVFSDRLFERQFKIGFCSQEIKNAYDKLLENCCKICDNIPPFRAFSMLSDHMRKVHERYFCDLCVKHLRIFTSERKCYTRQELAHHRRKGDLDDTSHRGHPLCEFCEERFMDADELYRHLRKEHLYCHLCDADGRNLYYASHAALAQHFRTDHYLCEEGECAGEHLTAVFRSDIDLKAHKATIHGRGMTRNASRQARTLELQFNITPHPVAHQRQPRDRDRERGGERDRGGERERDREREREREQQPSPPALVQQQHIDTRSDEQFPRLSAAPAQPNLILAGASPAYRGSSGLARTNKNFPTLGGAPAPAPAPPRPAQPVASAVLRNSKPSVSIQLHSQPASASNFRLTQTSGNRISLPPRRSKLSDDFDDEDFPSLGVARDDHPSLGASSLQPPKVTMINSQEMSALSKSQNSHHNQPKKAPLSSEAFPALSASAAPSAPPQWITIKGKDKKAAKPEPPPPPKQPAFNPVADFPTLPITAKPKKSKAPQAPPKPEPPPEPIKLSKKDKKKQNSKKENISEFAYVNGVDKNIAKELSYGAASAPGPKPEEKKVKTVEVEGKEKRNGGNGDFALAARDYPPLNARSDNGPPSARKMNGAPPGFRPRPACDGLKFTNSSGQTFRAPLHAYIPPPDFEPRNRALVAAFARALDRQASIDDFKVASRAFRDSIIGAEEFYAHCRSAVGPQLDGLLGELVALLPDIAKQQELAVGRDVGLGVCQTCGQLLAHRDALPHEQAHWPPLAR